MEKQNYQICNSCVMDNSDPNIIFDAYGVCDHCSDFYKYIKPKWPPDETQRKNFERTIKKIKQDGEGNEFDCILGLSGGSDSSYLLHLAVKEFNLRPLVFHVDGGWNTELAVHNINVLINKLGLDLYTEVVNWEEMRDFQLAMFKSGLPNIDIPQDLAFIGVLYHYAKKNKIKFILNGGNFSTECVQYPMKWLYYGTDMRHNKDIIKKFGTIAMKTYPFTSILYHKVYLRYFKGVKMVKPLNYVNYIKPK